MKPDPVERLRAELEVATAELKAHLASWEYAFAMGGGREGGRNHPVHQQTRARTEELQARYACAAAACRGAPVSLYETTPAPA